jgi:hypothetical protein
MDGSLHGRRNGGARRQSYVTMRNKEQVTTQSIKSTGAVMGERELLVPVNPYLL